MESDGDCLFVVSSIAMTSLLSVSSARVGPSLTLDVVGRLVNLYELAVHGIYIYQFVTRAALDTVYGGMSEQSVLQSTVASTVDFVGWLAILSRLGHASTGLKMIANFHAVAVMLAIIDMDTFQRLFIRRTADVVWDITRASFVLADAVSRTYFQFVVLA